MMPESIISSVICSEFDKVVGRWQSKKMDHRKGKLVDPEKPMQAMEVKFSLNRDYDTEEGYRHLTIRLFGYANYVMVLLNEDWNVLPKEDLEWDENAEESFIKKGSKGYTEGNTGWVYGSYHDSCWRDAVDEILRVYSDTINSLDWLFCKGGAWYNLVEITEEERERMYEVVKAAQDPQGAKFLKYQLRGPNQTLPVAKRQRNLHDVIDDLREELEEEKKTTLRFAYWSADGCTCTHDEDDGIPTPCVPCQAREYIKTEEEKKDE